MSARKVDVKVKSGFKSREKRKPIDKVKIVLVVIVLLVSIVIYLAVAYEGVLDREIALIPFLTTTTRTTTTTTTIPTTAELLIMEKLVHDVVNQKRNVSGIDPLKWNERVAEVARNHSKTMADTGEFNHTVIPGFNLANRLRNGSVYNWNVSGENILKINIVRQTITRYVEDIPVEEEKVYYTKFEMVNEAVNGWMNSSGHRKNILTEEFNEAGVGIYLDPEGNYFMTQNFISTTDCGYITGPCCHKTGYSPYCYIPFDCVSNICQ
jgi:uncharacterized protein YkwD